MKTVYRVYTYNDIHVTDTGIKIFAQYFDKAIDAVNYARAIRNAIVEAVVVKAQSLDHHKKININLRGAKNVEYKVR